MVNVFGMKTETNVCAFYSPNGIKYPNTQKNKNGHHKCPMRANWNHFGISCLLDFKENLRHSKSFSWMKLFSFIRYTEAIAAKHVENVEIENNCGML